MATREVAIIRDKKKKIHFLREDDTILCKRVGVLNYSNAWYRVTCEQCLNIIEEQNENS